MPPSPLPAAATRTGHRLRALHRLFVVTLLGFASGLPLALTGQALQAWLSLEGLDVATIGFLSLVGLPYTFKFLWAPLMDRFDPPGLGRRRGWLVLTQLALAGALMALAATSPSQSLQTFALLAVAVAFLSASQDVAIDAYRTDLLPAAERGLGSSLNVMGYRLAMILSGGVALIWTDPQQGGGWSWPQVYRLMAGLMVADDLPLSELVAELERYRRGHLGCAPAVAGLRISGVFRLDDTDAALSAITRTLPVRIQRVGPYWTRIDAR